ncbi:energy transducer TonB [Trichlorobacter lovleyi]|uniref:TonB family protein n=1 Tax=Trichlorobacter lovleyi (strain ATCC BAA-1151 / DSM 17278 / SZ) TaxID=398767 RepID=B3E7G2_TRIL1|nr:energy transducer TonB [Trichlorobacter lovleyi]ACD96479.1 TonB family protein [Trichlorobacter lovleyi SZ]
MSAAHQSRKTRSIRLYLSVSLLLHGLFFVAAIVLLPPLVQAPPKEPALVMTHLVSLPTPNAGKETTSPAPALPVINRPTPKSQPQPQPPPPKSVAPTTFSSNPPLKPSEPAPQAPPAPTFSAQQTKAGVASKPETGSQPAVQTSTTTGGNRIAPQEMAFGSASGPAFRRQAVPVYPALAKRRNKEGVVLLRLSISETGQLTQLEVLEDPGYGFGEAAQEAVRNSSFTPARHNGKPVAVRAVLPIRFSLR